jgi:excisionase family DNA binding protein
MTKPDPIAEAFASFEGVDPRDRLTSNDAGRPSVETKGSLLVTAREAASLLGCSLEALRKRVQRAQLPRGCVVQVGRSYRFRRDRLL